MDPVLTNTLISLGGIGFVLGAGLAFASKQFAVKIDPLVGQITETLPGANCGGCGYAGCAGYADALVLHGAPETLCAPGGRATARAIAQILGREAKDVSRRVAYLHCAGSRDKAKDKYRYVGAKNCRMAAALAGGPKACDWGCMGFGSCVEVCKFDALHMGENGLPVVDRAKCTACGACVRECPKGLFSLEQDITSIYLACSSHDKGKAVKEVCTVGCIGCGICAKVTEGGAIEMKDNLPVVNYESTPNLVLAQYKCPSKSYIDLSPKRPYMNIDQRCKGTGNCVAVCPVKGCISGEPGKPHQIDPKVCIGCGLCLSACPEKAIHVVGAMGYVGMDPSR